MSAFDTLHPAVQRWVFRQGWPSLRPIQDQAIKVVLQGTEDLLIAAPTAGGKTEAAWLPIATQILQSPQPGVRALMLSPLRALISDQVRRLESLAEATDLRVQGWHGDISKGKSSFFKRPTEILIITPESFESMLMRRALQLAEIFQHLDVIVIDELHAFFESPRGAQLQSLLHRLDTLLGRRPRRVALSATLGDPGRAARFLRPGTAPAPRIITEPGGGGTLRVALRCYIPPHAEPPPTPSQETPEPEPAAPDVDFQLPAPPKSEAEAETLAEQAAHNAGAEETSMVDRLAADLYHALRGKIALIFANARGLVEEVTDAMVARAQNAALPVETFCHHGSLSREHRTDVEERLRDGTRPTQVVCTSTLELGIDIGDVEQIAQVGPAPSAASLKQRVGRSGRRPGSDQVLRQYVLLRDPHDAGLPERLQLPLIQAIATIEALVEGDFEPPRGGDLHLSTLCQQILARIAQERAGLHARRLHSELCAAEGGFGSVDPGLFVDVLRSLGGAEWIEQIDEGTLLPGREGERLIDDYRMLASFATPEEYSVLTQDGRLLGTIPIDDPILPGQLLVMAGRRWKVLDLDGRTRTLVVAPGPRGRPPLYASGGPSVSRKIHQRMRGILLAATDYRYLDETARGVLRQSRRLAASIDLQHRAVTGADASILWWHWAGTRVAATLALLLARAGIEVEVHGPALRLAASIERWPALHQELQRAWPAAAEELMNYVPVVLEDKFDEVLSPSAMRRQYVSRHIDLEGAQHALDTAIAGVHEPGDGPRADLQDARTQ